MRKPISGQDTPRHPRTLSFSLQAPMSLQAPPCHCERSEAIHQNHIKRLLRASQ